MKFRLCAVLVGFGLVTGLAEAGTGDELVAKGATVTAGEMSYTISFNDDGSYATSTGETGVYALNADEICLTPDGGAERCVSLPSGNGSGSTFDVAGPDGRSAKMRIH